MQNMELPGRRRGERAFALVLVLFLVFVLSILAYAAARVASLDGRGATAEINSAGALFAARAGIQKAIVALAHDRDWASGTARTGTIGSGATAGTYSVTSTFYASVNWWKVTSVGTVGGVSHTVDAWLGPLSFAEFAYFSDSEQSPLGGTVNFITADTMTGKVHTNGWYSIQGHPKFSKKVTSSNLASSTPGSYTWDPYYNTTTKIYHQGSTNTTDRSKFYHYSSSYSSDSMQALSGSPAFSFQGAVAPYNLHGVDVSNIEANADIRIPPVGSIPAASPLPADMLQTDVTVNFNVAGTVTISYPAYGSVPAYSHTFPVTSNTIYISTDPSHDGTLLAPNTIGGHKVIVHGTVKGQVTVATNNGIDIDANLIQNDKTTDSLGLVCTGTDFFNYSHTAIVRNAIMVATSSTVAANIEIDATMMAQSGSFGVQNYGSGIPRGTLTIYGGIIEAKRGPVGTSSSGSVVTGYAKNYTYDSKLIKSPPPNYPITGIVYVKSFSDRGALK